MCCESVQNLNLSKTSIYKIINNFKILQHFINSDLGQIRHTHSFLLHFLILYTPRMVAESDRNILVLIINNVLYIIISVFVDLFIRLALLHGIEHTKTEGVLFVGKPL